MTRTERWLLASIIFVCGFIVMNEALSEGTVYREGTDLVIATSCTPPNTRQDGNTITPQEMDQTRLRFSKDETFAVIEHEIIVPNIICEQEFALANLASFGQWYWTASIHAEEGGWSNDQPERAAFEWLAAIVAPPPLPPEILKADWTVHYVSSEELVNWNMPATQSFDGNKATLWHSQYQGLDDVEEPFPHTIEINMGGVYQFSAFQIQPRTGGVNAVVKDFELYSSMDGSNWSMVFDGSMPEGDALQTVEFAPVNARYFKFVALSEQDGGNQASVAEFYAYGEPVILQPPAPPSALVNN